MGTKKQDASLAQLNNRAIILERYSDAKSISARTKARTRMARVKAVSHRELKRKGLCDVRKDNFDSGMLEQLRAQWRSYIAQLGAGAADVRGMIMQGELVGCVIRVVESRNPGVVGLQGTVVRSSSNTFAIVTQTGAVRTILRHLCVCATRVANMAVLLHGDKMLPHVKRVRNDVS
jgi:RNase P/RNase MRP subunit p29